MVYMVVVLIAGAAGGLVYWLTLRAGVEPQAAPFGDGFFQESTPSAVADPQLPAPPGGGYVPLITDRRSWQTRVLAVLGLFVLVLLAAALLAFTIFQIGSAIAHVISNYASGSA